MKYLRKLIVLSIAGCTCWSITSARALELESFQFPGSLTWSNIPGQAYTVEWSPYLGGTWYSDWCPPGYLGPFSGTAVTSAVPMFYRVVTATNPPPDSIFVSPVGTNNPTCGEPGNPCQTITFGISRAVNEGRSSVAVAQGIYEENISLVDGISVLGGYGPVPSWCQLPDCRPVIMGGQLDTETVLASDITVSETRLEGFTIHAPNPVSDGVNSIGIRILNANSNLVIRNNCIIGQAGADGAAGGRGTDGPDGGNGAPGNMPAEAAGGFNNNGGGGGANFSLDGQNLGGGSGGNAAGPVTYDTSEGTGINGGGLSPGTGGSPGWNGKRETPNCGIFVSPLSGGVNATSGQDGQPGSSGSGGLGASNTSGTFIGGQWVGSSGFPGNNGADGSGGGGGGAGGGSEDISCTALDVVGPSGGGGGAGGGGARGGLGGGPGGGSFGILIFLFAPVSRPVIEDNIFYLGVGGDGGAGGAGGEGGAAGLGGLPQTSNPSIFGHGEAGPGGNGGAGGHGGGGGGGAGGPAAGIIMNYSAPEYSGANTFQTLTGRAGEAGQGGFSFGGGVGENGIIGSFSTVISLP